MNSTAHKLEIVRIFEAAPEQVYAAWTDIDTMRRWFGHLVEADARVGGAYRVENPSGDGGRFAHVGKYLVLEPPHRIVMSFTFEGTEPHGFTDEYIEMQFRPLSGGRTEMRFTNAWNGPGMDDAEQGALNEGWGTWFDQLARALSGSDVIALY
ncbi:MAG TPA: SRPBCC domain-containing protein [Devosia sp.]|jgi:uncharacterized protein YndB with AHSA1/START domain|uniref:SRPBCC family protein n=1 Tax=Devosia sp. TaxID=1871048 RepID=UPI002DDCF91C|nr:SRPBCC domain-containing protein [Devosia sp.]HEV2516827.1 SRPBCC domain-containing protein [Devosia sp.]